MKRRDRQALALGFLGGLVVGYALWSGGQVAGRRDLFNRSPLRRLAALGYLAGQPSAANARLLRDYVQWERRDDLRRRGKRILGEMERRVG
jgi:hypothetical protein